MAEKFTEALCDTCGLPAMDFIGQAGVVRCVECESSSVRARAVAALELGNFDHLPTREALELARHDVAVCDCGGCENVRRAERSH